LDLGEWLGAAVDSAKEIATGPLCVTTAAWRETPGGDPPVDMYAVYIPLSCDGLRLQLGLLAERPVWVLLARAFIGLEPEEPLDSDEDVLDAAREVANLVAGGIKVRVTDSDRVSVGLPLALRGRVFPSAGSRSRLGVFTLDDREVWLILTGTKSKTS